MFAGIEGVGADDAWWETALNIELHQIGDTPCSGAAADIYKCFDQISRPLLYQLARAAGMPERIVDAHARYQNNLDVYNAMALGLPDMPINHTASNRKGFHPHALLHCPRGGAERCLSYEGFARIPLCAPFGAIGAAYIRCVGGVSVGYA